VRAIRFTAALVAALGFATCAAQSVVAGAGASAAEAKDMALVGYHDLQARSAYQPVVQEQNGRWIAYIGHHGGTEKVAKPVNALTGKPEFNGTSILDVTDPRTPRYLAHIPGEEGQGESGGAQMVRVCAAKGLLNRLNVIDETRASLIKQGVTPHFVIAFRGPATKLVQTDMSKVKPEDRELAGKIAARIRELSTAPGVNGIEQCSVAIRQQETKAENVLPEIKVIGNSWISLMAYQSKGYAYIQP